MFSTKKKVPEIYSNLLWFLCFNGISAFMGYLMPKLFL